MTATNGTGEGRPGDEQAEGVSHERSGLGLRPDHHARRVDERHEREAERVAQLHEPRGLVRGVANDRSRHVHRVVGDDPIGRPSMRASAVTISGAKRSRRKVTDPLSVRVSMIGLTG